MRTSLPPIEQFSRNPRNIKAYKKVPALSLLGLNYNNKYPKSYRSTNEIRLPALTKYPALDGLDPTIIKPLPGAPLRPSEVIKAFSDCLVPLELGEILSHTNIYYIGTKDVKPTKALTNTDYDNAKKQYQAKQNDQIYYRYQVLSYAGGGAFANVYKCYDHKLQTPVALKIIRAKPDCLQYAEMEAKIQADIESKHSVKLLDSFNWRGHFCLSMELLYTDIYSIIEQHNYQQLHPDCVRRITFNTLLCLREMASKGMVHADIKPENILTLDQKMNFTKLGDFGTACYADEQIFSYIQSRYYRAPEVLYGIRYGPQIDMWSLGCVIYELLVGQPLYPAQDEEELCHMFTVSIGPPPTEFYSKGTKWSYFKKHRKYGSDIVCQPLTYMVAMLPRNISKFIRSCLVWDPYERLSPEEALQTDWMLSEIENIKKHQQQQTIKTSNLPVLIHEPNTARTRVPWRNK